MVYGLIADLVLVAHFAYVVFTVFGGLLAIRWRWLIWVHFPTVCWGIILQWADLSCLLTPLENYLRQAAGEGGYSGGFIEHYISIVLYPEYLPIELRYLLGLIVLVVNVPIYIYLFKTRSRTAYRSF